MKKTSTAKKPAPLRKEPAAKAPPAPELAQVLAELQAQVAALGQRLERLEAAATGSAQPERTAGEAGPESKAAPLAPAPEPKAAPAAPKAPLPAEKPAAPGITEEEILAVSAALAAYLGVRVRIRQIRLLSSPAWAQQGRVSIQASHHLHN